MSEANGIQEEKKYRLHRVRSPKWARGKGSNIDQIEKKVGVRWSGVKVFIANSSIYLQGDPQANKSYLWLETKKKGSF